MTDERAPEIVGPANWRVAVAAIGWLVLLVCLIGTAALILEGFRSGVGLALHANPDPRERYAATSGVGVWLIMAGAGASSILALVGKRWVLLILSVVFLLFAFGLTQVRIGA